MQDNRLLYKWNPIFNLIMELKDKYIKKFPRSMAFPPYYYYTPDESCIERWVRELEGEEIDKFKELLLITNINQYDRLILIKYNLVNAIQYSDMWANKDSIYREARSIVIDIVQEKIVLCPFRKFFNVSEVEENTVENLTKEIQEADVVEFSNKLDCSLQNASWYNDSVILCGSSSLTPDNSWRLVDGYKKLTENYVKMISENKDLTFSFENVNCADKHVVNYKEEEQGLYLIGIRDNKTGFQYSYKECKEFANKYNVLMTEIENISLEDVLKLSKEIKSTEKEGWVCYLRKGNNYHLVKLKTEDYLKVHKLIGHFTSPNYIIQALYEDRLDEFITQAPNSCFNEIMRIVDLVEKYVKAVNHNVSLWLNKAPKSSTKEFMIFIEKNAPRELWHYIKCAYLHREYNVLQKGKEGCKTAKEIGINEGEII